LVYIVSVMVYKYKENAEVEKYKYKCDNCKFKTNDKKDYRRHLLTLKHKKINENTENSEKPKVLLFICDCGKEYKHKSGYYRHKKNCNYKKAEEVLTSKPPECVPQEINYKELFLQMLNQNKELQELLITQQQEYKKEQKEI
jgi:uncharacterized Zn-finger protein